MYRGELMYLCPQPRILELKDGMYFFPVGTMPKVEKKKNPELLEKESYRINIDKKGVLIEAADDRGLYYGELTLKQLMLNYRGCLPYLYIYDEPEFSYRGFMIDSCRHFFTVEEIKKMIDGAALFKFNKFHFHLSEDQGFRIEMESYPLLTSVGSVRPSSNFGRGENDNTPYGGYYTKEELKDIVKYCQERYIEVIPEFDFPGHTTAVISAYPELCCTGEKIELKTTAGVFKDILCVGNPETLKFIYAVIDELCEIFPSKYFHIGGDEAPKTRWLNCPKCKAKLEEEGLHTMDELQGWLANEAAAYLKKKGRKAICWNEALNGGNLDKDNITVALWMDKTNKAIEWANGGNPVIMEKFTPYYVDYPYGMHSLKDVYMFNPRKVRGLTSLGGASVKGVESPIWTEYVRDFKTMSYMCFPRWLAVAETGWNGVNIKGYQSFLKSAEFYSDILKGMGHNPAPKSHWNVAPYIRLNKTVGFFKNTLTVENVKNFLKKD